MPNLLHLRTWVFLTRIIWHRSCSTFTSAIAAVKISRNENSTPNKILSFLFPFYFCKLLDKNNFGYSNNLSHISFFHVFFSLLSLSSTGKPLCLPTSNFPSPPSPSSHPLHSFFPYSLPLPFPSPPPPPLLYSHPLLLCSHPPFSPPLSSTHPLHSSLPLSSSLPLFFAFSSLSSSSSEIVFSSKNFGHLNLKGFSTTSTLPSLFLFSLDKFLGQRSTQLAFCFDLNTFVVPEKVNILNASIIQMIP